MPQRLENRNSGSQRYHTDFKLPAIGVRTWWFQQDAVILLPRCLGRRIQLEHRFQVADFNHQVFKVGPYDRFQWSYDPYKWLYKWLTGVITHYCKIFRSYNYIIPSIRSLILGGPALKVFLEPHPIRNSQDRRAVELDSDEENSEVPWRSDTPLGGSSYEL